MRVLVTGGTGFIGSNLVIRLMQDGHDVLITGCDSEQKIPGFRGKLLQPGFTGIDWDAVGKVDVLFHQAAINDTTSLDEREMLRANVESSQELFRRVVAGGCRRIVYATSTAVYGDGPTPYRENQPLRPLNPYALSKKRIEEFAAEFARQNPEAVIVGLRYCNVYGPRENHKGPRASMIFQLARQMTRGNPRLFEFGEQKRDYIYVEDVVRANLLAARAQQSAVVNCGGGAATTFNDLVAELNRVLGLNRKAEYISNPYADRYQNHTECDMTLARERLAFTPEFNVRRGIEEYFCSGFLA